MHFEYIFSGTKFSKFPLLIDILDNSPLSPLSIAVEINYNDNAYAVALVIYSKSPDNKLRRILARNMFSLPAVWGYSKRRLSF